MESSKNRDSSGSLHLGVLHRGGGPTYVFGVLLKGASYFCLPLLSMKNLIFHFLQLGNLHGRKLYQKSLH